MSTTPYRFYTVPVLGGIERVLFLISRLRYHFKNEKKIRPMINGHLRFNRALYKAEEDVDARREL